MKKQQQEMFVSQQDLQNEIDKLQQSIRTANDANSRLNNCPDLIYIPAPLDLTTDWLQTYIEKRIDAVGKNLCFDSQTQKRMIEGWKKIEKKVMPDVKSVEKFCKSFKGLFRYDLNTEKMSFVDIEELARKRSERPVPHEFYQHQQLIEKLRSDVQELRRWEKVHKVVKRPLETLLQSNNDTLKSDWCKSTILIDYQEESQPYNRSLKWLRSAAEQYII